MKSVPYASAVGSIMYAQVRTRPDLAFVTGMLGRFQSNPGPDHWKAAKKVLRYMQGTKNFMLTYKSLITWKLLVTQTLILPGVWIVRNPRQVIYSHSLEEPYRGKAPSKR